MAKNSTVFGQTRVFSEQAPAIASGGNIPTIQYSTGNAKALADFSRSLFGLASQFEDQLDQQAEAEASKEGAIAGLAGDTEERDYGTIRGRSYNQAMLSTFVTNFDSDTMIGLERLKHQHWADPMGLETAANAYLDGRAGELEKIAPGSAASFRGRQIGRLLPDIERARDDRYRLTVDEANASLVRHEAMLVGTIKANAGDLFSTNPARAQAASGALLQAVDGYMRTYEAVDPVTGKPLFSATDKEKARAHIRDTAMSQATLGWFEQQEDKVEAYMKLQDPEFSFDIMDRVTAGGGAKAAKEYLATKSTHQNRPGDTSNLDDGFAEGLAGLIQAAPGDIGAGLQLGSAFRSIETQRGLWNNAVSRYGSQAAARKWVAPPGGSNHNHGKAVDLWWNGQRLDKAPKHVREWVHANASSFGLHVPLGHEPWHIEPLGTRGTKAPSRQPVEPVITKRPLQSSMSASSWNSLDAEMRQRIGFENSQADRAQRQQEAQIKAEQQSNEVDVTARIYSPGSTNPVTGDPYEAITVPEVVAMQKSGELSPEQSRAFIKAIETEAPERSDPVAYNDLMSRMYDGENVHAEILSRVDQLSRQDVKTLLDKNHERNVQGAGRLSVEEDRGLNSLLELIRPSSLMGTLDEGRFARAYEAEDEYIRRVKNRAQTGETVQEITRDIAARASMDFERSSFNALDKMIEPRFAVRTQPGRPIDVQASAKALSDALAQNKISREEAAEQGRLLRRWDELQKQLERDAANAAAEKGRR